MSNDFDKLFDAPALTPTPVSDKKPASESRSTWMAIFKAGASVRYKGESHTISHVLISKGQLFVSLVNQEAVVPSEKIEIEPTHIQFKPRTN